MSNTTTEIQKDLEKEKGDVSTTINTGDNAVQNNIQDGTTELEDSIDESASGIGKSVEDVFSATNIYILVGFLAIYFGISYFRKSNDGTNVEGPRRFTGMMIDIMFFIILGIALFLFLSTETTNKDETITSQFIEGITDYVDNPASVMISIFTLIGLYIVVYLFGIPMDKLSKPVSISILETLAWVSLVVILFVDVFKYMFGVSFDEIFAKIKAYFKGETEIVETAPEKCATKDLDEEDVNGEVFNVSNNLYTYDDAKAICKSYGAKIATYDQVEKAYNNGAEWCNYGWSDGQMALFPTQKNTWDKLQKLDEGVCENSKKRGNNCGRPGINGGYIANPYVRFGVNCFGDKPAASEKDLNMMETKKDQVYPKTPDERKLEKKVNYWKENANKYLQLNSYNTKKWTEKNTTNTNNATTPE